MNTKLLQKEKQAYISLQRLDADKLLRIWRRKYSRRLSGLNAVKAIRELREGKIR